MLERSALLSEELFRSSEYIVSVEERCFEANKTSLDLLTCLRDTELEVEALMACVIELKMRLAVYIPVKDCPIDIKLAECINNYPDRQKLKIMFMRESAGVYTFGAKRVLVKVERDKI